MKKTGKAMKLDMAKDKKLGIKEGSKGDKKIDSKVQKSGKSMSSSQMKSMMKGAKPLVTIKIMAKKKGKK